MLKYMYLCVATVDALGQMWLTSTSVNLVFNTSNANSQLVSNTKVAFSLVNLCMGDDIFAKSSIIL